MENNLDIQNIIEISKKPMTGFSVESNSDKLTIKVNPKTILFGCLSLFIVALSLILFFFIETVPFKYIFAIAPIILGMISLSKLAKNATQTTFYNKNRIIIQENNNFIGKLFNKPINHKYSEIIDIVAREEKIRNNSSSNNSTNINYVYKVYIVLRAHELQLISVNKGVLDLSEIEEFATTIKNIVTKS